jgi:hypothetical protein
VNEVSSVIAIRYLCHDMELIEVLVCIRFGGLFLSSWYFFTFLITTIPALHEF